MSACKEIVPRLGALLDHELSPSDRAEVADHVDVCAGCSERAALFKAQGAALRERAAAREVGADFSRLTDRVMSRVAFEKRPAGVERISLWSGEMWGAHRPLLAAAGSIALAAGVGLAVFLQPARVDEVAQQAESIADAAQPQVDEVDFGTHDGAVMRLQDRTPVIWLGEDDPQ